MRAGEWGKGAGVMQARSASAVGHRCWHRKGKGNRLNGVHTMDTLRRWAVVRRQAGRQDKRADDCDQKDNEPCDAAVLHIVPLSQ